MSKVKLSGYFNEDGWDDATEEDIVRECTVLAEAILDIIEQYPGERAKERNMAFDFARAILEGPRRPKNFDFDEDQLIEFAIELESLAKN